MRVFTLNREGALREETLRLAGIKRGASVLDVGCGTGSLTLRAKLLAGSEGQVHGIDVAPEMIAKARRKAHAAGAQVDFQVGVIEALDFADGTFDRVLSSLMMHHLPGALKGQGLAEVRRECIPPHGPGQQDTPVGQEGPVGLQDLVRNAGFAGVAGGRLHSLPVAYVRGTRR